MQHLDVGTPPIAALTLLLTITLVLSTGGNARADAVIAKMQGQASHGATLTISGSGFGKKTPAPPVVWDNCSGTSPDDRWDFVYPYANDAAFRLTYRTPSQITKANGKTGGVTLPHSHMTRYLAGAHYNSSSTMNAHSGYNVCAGKNNQGSAVYTYISFYTTIDPDWHFVYDNPSPPENDHNFKEYDWAAGNGYMGDGKNLYFGRNQLPSSKTIWSANYLEGMNTKTFSVNESIMNFYPEYGTVFSTVEVPGPLVGWQKIEFVMKHRSDDGFHRVFQDNKMVWDATVNDDRLALGARAETVFGGYARESGSSEAYKNNWRYYADIYYDHSLARIVITDAADYASAKLIEVQIPEAWSDTNITFKVNQGKFADQAQAWVYVFDTAGKRSAQGYSIRFSSTIGTDRDAGVNPRDAGIPDLGSAVTDQTVTPRDADVTPRDADVTKTDTGTAKVDGGSSADLAAIPNRGDSSTDVFRDLDGNISRVDASDRNDALAAPGNQGVHRTFSARGGCMISTQPEKLVWFGFAMLALVMFKRHQHTLLTTSRRRQRRR